MNDCVRRGSGPAEQPRVEPIPVALKPAFGVVHQLHAEEFKSQVLGARITIPWTDDEVNPTFAKALLRLRIITGPESGPVAQKFQGLLRNKPLRLISSTGI